MSKKADRANEAREQLLKDLKPGDRVYCILKHSSASGMSRVIDLVVPYRHYENVYPAMPADRAKYPGQTDYDAKPTRKFIGMRVKRISHNAAAVIGWTYDMDRGGIKVSGCGMDMGFHTVYTLGAMLWPKGTKKPHGTRNGEPDTAGGYALKSEWL